MRALILTALATLLATALPAGAQDACAPNLTETYTTEAMVADAELRAASMRALDSCATYARDQQSATGEIEERVLIQIAALAGRNALSSYAADEIPKGTLVIAHLLENAFDQLYPHLRALPEMENAAVMRALFFQLSDQAGSRTTGTTPRSPERTKP
jgi:hypothetical protein